MPNLKTFKLGVYNHTETIDQIIKLTKTFTNHFNDTHGSLKMLILKSIMLLLRYKVASLCY